jgi:hypothetical protein
MCYRGKITKALAFGAYWPLGFFWKILLVIGSVRGGLARDIFFTYNTCLFDNAQLVDWGPDYRPKAKGGQIRDIFFSFKTFYNATNLQRKFIIVDKNHDYIFVCP